MTPEQWNSIQGDLTAMKILLISLAQNCPDPDELHSEFSRQREVYETAVLHSQESEEAIDVTRRKIDQIETVVWG